MATGKGLKTVMAEPDGGRWRNRIVSHGVKPAREFTLNPLNWRIHPDAQASALAGALGEVGWVDEVIENVTTGHVIDGHLRIALALREGDGTLVPYKRVELSEAEERLVLASLDPLAAMATADAEKLDALLREVATGDAALQGMLVALSDDNRVFHLGRDETGTRANDPVRKLESQIIKLALFVSDVTMVERAIRAVGLPNRGACLVEICRLYLEQMNATKRS